MISPARPQVAIDEAVKELIAEQHEQCTILHCLIRSKEDVFLRIWPTTYLVENDGSRRGLIKAFNISLMPDWTVYPTGTTIMRLELPPRASIDGTLTFVAPRGGTHMSVEFQEAADSPAISIPGGQLDQAAPGASPHAH